jgi:hypothetical protein
MEIGACALPTAPAASGEPRGGGALASHGVGGKAGSRCRARLNDWRDENRCAPGRHRSEPDLVRLFGDGRHSDSDCRGVVMLTVGSSTAANYLQRRRVPWSRPNGVIAMAGPTKCPTCGGRLGSVELQKPHIFGPAPRRVEFYVAGCPHCGASVPLVVAPATAMTAHVIACLTEALASRGRRRRR